MINDEKIKNQIASTQTKKKFSKFLGSCIDSFQMFLKARENYGIFHFVQIAKKCCVLLYINVQ